MADTADKLFDAISVLINKRVEAIHFDETKKAVITKVDQAEKGIYTVTEDSVYTYEAYSTVTNYKVNDTVLVTIPQGNYDNQKIIVGKSISGSGSPITYSSPFATIVDISNNIITENLGVVELYANSSKYVWPQGLTDFPREYNNSNSNTQINNVLEEDEEDWNTYQMQCIWESSNGLNLNGYTRIGLQAQVATYLGEYNTIFGNYGLALEVTYKSLESEEEDNTFFNCIIFDSDEFFGNVYRFDTYYTQEAVYDISDFLQFPIDKFRLFVYQRHNFIDKNGNRVPAPIDETDFSNIGSNILFKDFYLCVGEEVDNFKNDTAKLTCNNSLEYCKNLDTDSFSSDAVSLSDFTSHLRYFKRAVNLFDGKHAEVVKFNNNANLKQQEEFYQYFDALDLDTPNLKNVNLNQLQQQLHKVDFIDIPLNVDTSLNNIDFIALEEIQSFLNRYENKFDISDYSKLKSAIVGLQQCEEYNFFDVCFNLPSLEQTVNTRTTSNSKEIELVWLHKEITSGIVTRIESSSIPKDYHIYWYRYKLGASSPDIYAGPMWERFYGCKETPNLNTTNYCITYDEYAQENSRDIATDQTIVNFIPDVNLASEQLKAIIVREENDNIFRFVAATIPIEFINQNEVRSEATVIDLNTLAIRAEDDQQGKYFIYNRADKLEESDANLTRSLVALFDENPNLYDKTILTEYSTIEWTFPVENTMIIPAVSTEAGAAQSISNVITGTNRVGYYIKPHLDRSAANNTVQLRVLRDGLYWTADITLLFGTAGTSGSDYTVVLTWQNQTDRALDVTYPGWHSLKGQVGLYDNHAGNFIDFPNDSIIKYDWAVSDIIPYFQTSDTEVQPNKTYYYKSSETNRYEEAFLTVGDIIDPQDYYEIHDYYGFKYDNRDLYYPIFATKEQLTFEITDPDPEDQTSDIVNIDALVKSKKFRISDSNSYGGYYYFYDFNYNDICTELHKIFNATFSYSPERGFQYTGTIIKQESITSSLAYFNFNEKKYKLLSECSMFTVQTDNDNTYGFLEDNGYRIDWLYRKKKNNTKLTKLITVNKNEELFKLIFETCFNLEENVYDWIFEHYSSFWKDILTLRLKENIEQYQINENITEELKKSYLDTIYDSQNDNSVVKDRLQTWINNHSSVNKEVLFSFIFTNINIYELILKNLENENFPELDINQSLASSLSNSKLNKYVYYDLNSDNNFKSIFENVTNKEELISALNNYIWSNNIIYDFNSFENNLNEIQYEFSKPEIEFLPLTITDTTYQIASGDLSKDIIKDTLNTFNVNYIPVASQKNNTYYSDLYNAFYQESNNNGNDSEDILTGEELDTALSKLDAVFADLKNKNNIFGFGENVTGYNPENSQEWYSQIFGENLDTWSKVWGQKYSNHTEDIFAIVDFYQTVNNSSITTEEKNNFKIFMYNNCVKDFQSAVLDYYILNYNASNHPALKAVIDNKKEYLDLAKINLNNVELPYITIYEQFSAEKEKSIEALRKYYTTINTKVVNKEIYKKEDISFVEDIHNYFTDELLNDAADKDIDDLIALWFVTKNNGSYSDTKFKTVDALSQSVCDWYLIDQQNGNEEKSLITIFKEKGLLNGFNDITENVSNIKRNLLMNNDILEEFNTALLEILIFSNNNENKTLFKGNDQIYITNLIKGKILNQLLNTTNSEIQYNNYVNYFSNYSIKLTIEKSRNILGINDNNYNLYYKKTNGNYENLEELFQIINEKQNNVVNGVVSSTYAALQELYNIFNYSDEIIAINSNSTGDDFYQKLFTTLFIDNFSDENETIKTLIQEALNSDYFIFFDTNNRHYIIKTGENGVNKNVRIQSTFSAPYYFKYNKILLLDLINNHENIQFENIYHPDESASAGVTQYIKITAATIKLNINEANTTDLSAYLTQLQSLSNTSECLFNDGVSKKLHIEYDIYDSGSTIAANFLEIDLEDTTSIWTWLFDNENYLNMKDDNNNALITPEKIFESLTGYSINLSTDDIYKYLLLIRCVNKFKNNINKINSLSNQHLIISKENNINIKEDIVQQLIILDDNKNADSLSVVSDFILENYYYKNSSKITESVTSEYYDSLNFVSLAYYNDINYYYDNIKFDLLFQLLMIDKNNTLYPLTNTEICNTIFNDSNLFWKYFAFSDIQDFKSNNGDYLVRSVDMTQFVDANSVLDNYIFINDDSSSIIQSIYNAIQGIVEDSYKKFVDNNNDNSNAVYEMLEKYQKNNIYNYFHSFYSSLSSTVTKKLNATNNLYEDLMKLLFTDVYFKSFTNPIEHPDLILETAIEQQQALFDFSSLDTEIFESKFMVDIGEKKLYNIKYEMSTIDSGEKLFNILTSYKGKEDNYCQLTPVENISSLKNDLLTYFDIPDNISSTSQIFDTLIGEAIEQINKLRIKTILDNHDNETFNTLPLFSQNSEYGYYVYLANEAKIKSIREYFSFTDYLYFQYLYELYTNTLKINNIYQIVNNGNLSIKDSSMDFKLFNYYNKNNQKAFINVDGYYVVDPFDEWQEGETYYEPIQVIQKQCYTQPLQYKLSSSNLNNPSYPNDIVEIYPSFGLTTSQLMNSLSVLRVTVSNFGDYDLIVNEAIPLKNNTETNPETGQVLSEYRYINGATYVRYSSGGTLDYDNTPYELFQRVYDDTSLSKKITLNSIDLTNDNLKLLIPSESLVEQTNNTNFIPIIQNKILKPAPVYIPNLGAYGIQFIQDDGTVVWTQPINIFEDNYPSTTLNQWNGRDIKTDEDTGTILTSAISAGKKERDNTFTGVMMGDWSRTDTDSFITKQTGLYGFYHGSMSYAFTDDGKGFIGRDGRGRIYFDGNNSTIYSSNWKGNEQLGMYLDVDDGIIKLQAQDIAQPIDTRMRYITLSAKESTFPLSIGNNKFSAKRAFRVNWDGTAFLDNATVKGIIEATSGSLGDLEVEGTLSGGNISGSTISGSIISGAHLSGSYGEIGGWVIGPYGIYHPGGNAYLSSTNAGIVADRFTIKTATISNIDEVREHGVEPVIVSDTVLGHIGLEIGKNGQGHSTHLLSIRSNLAEGLAIESQGNIRISGNGSSSRAPYIILRADKIVLDSNEQEGIYARFA